MPEPASEITSELLTHSPIVTWGTRLIGIGLILLGLHVFAPELAAWGYGVTPVDQNGTAYLIATGARDLALGLMTLFLLGNYRQCIGVFLLCMLVIPIADTIIVLRFGAASWKVLPHVAGLIGIAVVAFSAFKEQQN